MRETAPITGHWTELPPYGDGEPSFEAWLSFLATNDYASPQIVEWLRSCASEADRAPRHIPSTTSALDRNKNVTKAASRVW